eukprot:TRINITY_DN62716_c0_g1_i1.p1 TRINITY_DN62716_c0_g1~~TRINITY_DN62716_c0_g1_i1.p1  ORF type:complete len:276 (-),score=53.92 TRINITY_DN62716_c0_g1_i1:122-949(-)
MASVASTRLAVRGRQAEEPLTDVFLVCVTRKHENCDEAARLFVKGMQQTIRTRGGKVQVSSGDPKNWVFLDGKDNFKEPNHLNPAIFNFDSIVMFAFSSTEELGAWWSSDEVFELMKHREAIEKIGLFAVDGLQPGYDVQDRSLLFSGEKFVLLEFMKLDAFKPVQHYVDCYKRCAERSNQEVGIECNLLYAESVSATFMGEFPLDAVCASTWRMRSDAHYFYDSNAYQETLAPLRHEYSKSVALICPIHEDVSPEHSKSQETKRDVLRALTVHK